MYEYGFTSESWSPEARADVLRRRIKLYRVCLNARIGGPAATDYRREIAMAEAELAKLLRTTESAEGSTTLPKI